MWRKIHQSELVRTARGGREKEPAVNVETALREGTGGRRLRFIKDIESEEDGYTQIDRQGGGIQCR